MSQSPSKRQDGKFHIMPEVTCKEMGTVPPLGPQAGVGPLLSHTSLELLPLRHGGHLSVSGKGPQPSTLELAPYFPSQALIILNINDSATCVLRTTYVARQNETAHKKPLAQGLVHCNNQKPESVIRSVISAHPCMCTVLAT